MKHYFVTFEYNGEYSAACIIAASSKEAEVLIKKQIEDEGGDPNKATVLVQECIDMEDW